MIAEFGDFDKEQVDIPIRFTLKIGAWRELASELVDIKPHSMRMKQFINQMLSEKVDNIAERRIG